MAVTAAVKYLQHTCKSQIYFLTISSHLPSLSCSPVTNYEPADLKMGLPVIFMALPTVCLFKDYPQRLSFVVVNIKAYFGILLQGEAKSKFLHSYTVIMQSISTFHQRWEGQHICHLGVENPKRNFLHLGEV